MGWLVSSRVSQLPFCPSCSQATIILPNDKAAENPEMFEIGRSDRQGIQTMRESSTYQAILREGRQEGRVEGEQKLLLRQGTKRFGNPNATTVAAIEAVRDIDRLENLGERILDPGIRDWDELLRTP
jgi:predicted transposase YdaD